MQRHGTVSSRHVDVEKATHFVRLFLVGVARFELAALRSRTVRATKLRYTPIVVFNYVVSSQNRNVLLCLVARLALTEGFAAVPTERVPALFPDIRRFAVTLSCNPNCATPRNWHSAYYDHFLFRCPNLMFGSA